jgi:hypothetical protein
LANWLPNLEGETVAGTPRTPRATVRLNVSVRTISSVVSALESLRSESRGLRPVIKDDARPSIARSTLDRPYGDEGPPKSAFSTGALAVCEAKATEQQQLHAEDNTKSGTAPTRRPASSKVRLVVVPQMA